ncbi:transcriptional regulator [Streptomyces mashuensis]|uniref:Transcriptional regulator n=1 Tax=Streptomyces mashuensis TaxID=33904 RepID=A0A919B4W6_9ACTN|nr:transcriptional regulator [Streptomyces mashuensis]
MTQRREEEELLGRFLTARPGGRPRAGLVAGTAGSGKTTLLQGVAERVVASGALLLGAAASPAERYLPYAVVEQLLQGAPPLCPGVVGAGFPQPGGDGVPEGFLDAFCEALAGPAGNRPLLIAVDDAQFADEHSLACLEHAVRRLPADALGLLLVDGGSGDARTDGSPGLRRLLDRVQVREVRLGPLSQEGVRELLAEERGAAEAARIAPACHAATGGNPLLLRGLLDDAGTGGGVPQPGELFRQAVMVCLHSRDDEALRVARGIAVLGRADRTRLLARLTVLSEETVRRCVAVLAGTGLLAGGVLRHEAIAGAVLQELSAPSLARLRWRAACLLHDDGAEPGAVARQLVDCDIPEPAAPWVPLVLRAAARVAVAANRPHFAARCLQTAERHCPDERQRLSVTAELAHVFWQANPSAFAQRLRSLAGPARSGLLPPEETLRLAAGMLWTGLSDDAAAAIQQAGAAVEQSTDPRLAGELRAVRLMVATTYPTVLDRIGGAAPGTPDTVAPRLRAFQALRASLERDVPEAAPAAAEEVLRTTAVTDHTHHQVRVALLALVYAERLGAAGLWCERFLARTDARTGPAWVSALQALRGHIALRRGDLTKAVDCARRSLEHLPAQAWGVGVGMPLAVLVEALTAKGRHQDAAELLEIPVPEAMTATRYGMHYVYARGLHQLATGRHHAALADFLACGERLRGWDMDTASVAPWRLGAAETWLAMGRPDRAEQAAREQLERVTRQQERVRGGALRLLAATSPPDRRGELLQEAVTALRAAGDGYGTALALADLGRAHERAGDVTKARLLVRQARRMAEVYGAEALHRALGPAPARGGQAAAAPAEEGKGVAPVTSLTDAERRVAALAAYGYTNREIAAKLFVTVSTVEQHLTRVYRKTNITQREDLPVTLDMDVADTA